MDTWDCYGYDPLAAQQIGFGFGFGFRRPFSPFFPFFFFPFFPWWRRRWWWGGPGWGWW